jgi:hypothetical protein
VKCEFCNTVLKKNSKADHYCEKKWQSELRKEINSFFESESSLSSYEAIEGQRLPYRAWIRSYSAKSDKEKYKLEPLKLEQELYQTDLLIVEKSYGIKSTEALPEELIITPRVVIELKIGISTHEALAYGEKAGRHKQIHPALRYGVALRIDDKKLPWRLINNSANFDFMIGFDDTKKIEEKKELDELMSLIREEIKFSKTLEGLIFKKPASTNCSYFHRKLETKEND